MSAFHSSRVMNVGAPVPGVTVAGRMRLMPVPPPLEARRTSLRDSDVVMRCAVSCSEMSMPSRKARTLTALEGPTHTASLAFSSMSVMSSALSQSPHSPVLRSLPWNSTTSGESTSEGQLAAAMVMYPVTCFAGVPSSSGFLSVAP